MRRSHLERLLLMLATIIVLPASALLSALIALRLLVPALLAGAFTVLMIAAILHTIVFG